MERGRTQDMNAPIINSQGGKDRPPVTQAPKGEDYDLVSLSPASLQ